MNCLFQLVLNGPTKDVKFCDLSNLFDIELSFSVGFECHHNGCSGPSSLKSFQY